MAEEMTNVPQPTPAVAPPAPPEVSAWKQLGQNTSRTKPVTVARYALVIGALAALVWLANTAWQSLVPFVVGGFIAYAVLPFVNRLDRDHAALVGFIAGRGRRDRFHGPFHCHVGAAVAQPVLDLDQPHPQR